MDIERVKSLVDEVVPAVTELRHRLHQRPELALAEHETSALVRQTLAARTAVRVLEPLLGTDVVAMLDGHGPGRNVALRADMDGLPLVERTGLAYASTNPGCMHACGHDGHTAVLLGTAMVLSRLRDTFPGSVRFVFQPGEEVRAAGRDLVEKGGLANPRPDAVFALHAWNGIPVGVISSKPGAFLAAADFFRVTIHGKGGHGSKPEETTDPVLAAARVVEALHTIVSRQVSALDAAVLSVCRLQAGTNSNIIPDQAELEGTVRYLRPELGARIPALMHRVMKGVCDSLGATYEMDYAGPYVPTINDSDAVALGKRVAEELLGAAGWLDLAAPAMGGEDFAYYIREHRGAMFRLGMGPDSAPLHNPTFDFNDAALRPGILFLVGATLAALAG